MDDLGVVFPIPPAYKEDESLDLGSTEHYIEFLAEAGVTTIMTTAGTSQYNLLGYSEILDLNLQVGRCAYARKMKFIVGVPPLPNRYINRFVSWFNGQKQVAWGESVHALMVMWPDRYRTTMAVVDWLLRLDDVAGGIPLWFHAKPARTVWGGTHVFSASDIEALHGLARLSGVKEESMDSLDLPYQISRKAHLGFTVCLAGGSMRRAAAANPDKHVTWLAGIGSFFPEAEVAARKGWLHGYDALFRHTQQNIEDPAFDLAREVGWHPFMRATMAEMGLLPKYQRAPFSTDFMAKGSIKRYIALSRETINDSNLDSGAMHS